MRKNYVNHRNINAYRFDALINSKVKRLMEAEEKKKDDSKDVEEISDELEEKTLNELFGLGSSVKKPEKALSLENTDDENAELCIQWCAYFLSAAGNNVKKGLDNFLEKFGSVLVKMPKLLVKGVFMLLSGTIKATAYTCSTIAAVILGSISLLVRFVNSSVESAKEALNELYNYLARGIKQFYNWFNEKYTSAVDASKERLQLWLGITAGALMAIANKITGAAEALGDLFKQILKDAKDKKDAAVLLTKTWLSAKSDIVKKWITDTAGDIKKSVVDAWNSMEKKVRKGYNNVAEKLEGWMNDIKELIELTGKKIENIAKNTKDFAIDKKDKAMIWGIQKGVKALSKNYTEDQVVALVRKCYNENLVPDIRGNYHINEEYFYKKGTRMRSLYENKRIRKIKNLKLLK
jgi:methyl-accepting chemotaxis protein